MRLAGFLKELLNEGKVTVEGEITAFGNGDVQQALAVLKSYYNEDALEMPGSAPGFDPDASLWAAEYLYCCIQLTVLRDAENEKVTEHLKDFTGEITPGTIYSADLILRYLPAVFNLAKGLAPGDILVEMMKHTALQWPFSSAGMKLETEPDLSLVLSHPSLRRAYIDRVIKEKDTERLKNDVIAELVHESVGDHSRTLWPELEPLIKQE